MIWLTDCTSIKSRCRLQHQIKFNSFSHFLIALWWQQLVSQFSSMSCMPWSAATVYCIVFNVLPLCMELYAAPVVCQHTGTPKATAVSLGNLNWYLALSYKYQVYKKSSQVYFAIYINQIAIGKQLLQIRCELGSKLLTVVTFNVSHVFN